jgi:trans-aconitate methyltransferase
MTVRLAGCEVRTLTELRELYAQRIALYGFTSQAMFYRTRGQHARKLRAFASLVTQLPEGASLLDVGCGYGELLNFVNPRGSYLGIDLVEQFVLEARRRHPDRRFVIGDVFNGEVARHDWVLLLGVLSSVPDPMGLLVRSTRLARRGVLFDISLESRMPANFHDLFRWTPRMVVELMSTLPFAVTGTCDLGESWVLFRAERQQAAATPRQYPKRAASSLGP